MRLDPDASAVIVPVEIHGDKTYSTLDMILATGATFVTLPFDLVESLGYEPTQSGDTVRLMTASGIVTAPLVEIRRIRVLGMEAINVYTLCIDLPGDGRLGGLLGLSFLKHFDVDLHFRNRELSIR